MSKDIINVQYPRMEGTQSVASVEIEKTEVNPANGISIEDAFANKNNTLVICVENSSESDSSVTFVAGDNYPNAMLGNLEQEIPAETCVVFQMQDPSRFENKDGSLYIDFDEGFEGSIFAAAKSVGLNV